MLKRTGRVNRKEECAIRYLTDSACCGESVNRSGLIISAGMRGVR